VSPNARARPTGFLLLAGADRFRAYTGFAREPLVVVFSLFIDSPVMRRLWAAGLSVVASKVFHEARSGAAVVAKRWGVCRRRRPHSDVVGSSPITPPQHRQVG
jgi:hypothetical protein